MKDILNADGVLPADGQAQDQITAPIIPDGNKPQTVKYETYDKAMATLAKEKLRASDLEKQLSDIREKDMLQQGKYQELLAEKDKQLKEMQATVINEKKEKIIVEAKSIMTDVANKFGAHSADDIHRNIVLKDVTGLDGKVDPRLVEAKVEELKRTKQYLFKSSAARIADGAPQIGVSSQLSVNKLDTNKLAELYRKNASAKN